MTAGIRFERLGPVLEIVLDRPEAGNAASDAMAGELARILLEETAEKSVVVLRAAGDDFCVGRDTMGRPKGDRPEALERRHRTEVIFDCYSAFRRAEIPIVGVVRGRALGFGCALAALCDITIAADDATFQIPEMQHRTLPTMVMSALRDRVPRKALAYLVYTTELVPADLAVTYGIVSRVVPAAELDAAVDAAIGAIVAAPHAALRGAKEYLRSAYELSEQGARDFARNLHATVNSSSEMRASAPADGATHG